MPYSVEKHRGRGSGRGQQNGRGQYNDGRNSWRDSMERHRPSPQELQPMDLYQSEGTYGSTSRGTSGRGKGGSWGKSNGHHADPPTLPRRTLRGQPPQGARPAKKKKPSRSWTAGLYIAITCSCLALGCLAAGVATRYWIKTNINREALEVLAKGDPRLARNLNTNIHYRSSTRGLFSTCYNATTTLDERCEGEKGYELSQNIQTASWGDDYDLYVHLMRLFFVSLIFAMVFELLAIMLSVVGCMRESRRLLLITVAAAFFAFLFMVGGMGCFHAVDHYEMNRIHQEPFPADWKDSHPQLDANYTRSFGYSYFLGWVASTLSLISLVCFVISYISLGRQKARFPKRKREPAYANFRNPASSTATKSVRSGDNDEADTYYTTSSHASRNFAYEMAEKDIPPPDELDCLDESIFSESTRM